MKSSPWLTTPTRAFAPPSAHFAEVEATLRTVAPEADIDYRWSGQVVESIDGLPFIGRRRGNPDVAEVSHRRRRREVS